MYTHMLYFKKKNNNIKKKMKIYNFQANSWKEYEVELYICNCCSIHTHKKLLDILFILFLDTHKTSGPDS